MRDNLTPVAAHVGSLGLETRARCDSSLKHFCKEHNKWSERSEKGDMT